MADGILLDKPNNEELIKKLRFIPVEVLRTLTIDLFKGCEKELITFLEEKFEKKVRNVISFIEKLDKEDLSFILSYRKKLPKDKIENLYNEYLHGKYPTLFLFEVDKSKHLSHNELKERIKKEFEILNRDLEELENPKEKNFEVTDTKLENNVHEILFSFFNRLDYIDIKTDQPDCIYGKSFGACWISSSYNSMIIKCGSWKASDMIKKIIETSCNANIYSLYLNKELVDRIINPNTVVAGRYKKIFPTEAEVESKNLRDNHLLSKDEGKETNKNYQRKSSIHELDIFGYQVNVSITEYGKIHINKEMRKSDLRNWAFELLNKILTRLALLKKKNYDVYIKSINNTNIKCLNDLNPTTQKIFVELSIAIQHFKQRNESNFSTEYIINKVYNNFDKFGNFFIDFQCEKCNSTIMKCKKCENTIDLSQNKFALRCSKCDKTLDVLEDNLLCSDGHRILGNLADYVIGILSKEGRDRLNKLFKEISLNISLDDDEIIVIRNRNICFIKNDEKIEYTIDDLTEFKDLIKLQHLSQEVKIEMLNNLKIYTTEKCKNHSNEDCRKCSIEPPKGYPCIQRVFGSFCEHTEYHAHSGQEFGDFSFKTTLEGNNFRVPCIVKPYKNKKRKDKERIDLTLGNDERLLNQSYCELNSSTTHMIGVITGVYIDPKLKDAIDDITRYKKKKVLFVNTDDLIRIYSRFDWSKKQPMESLT